MEAVDCQPIEKPRETSIISYCEKRVLFVDTLSLHCGSCLTSKFANRNGMGGSMGSMANDQDETLAATRRLQIKLRASLRVQDRNHADTKPVVTDLLGEISAQTHPSIPS